DAGNAFQLRQDIDLRVVLQESLVVGRVVRTERYAQQLRVLLLAGGYAGLDDLLRQQGRGLTDTVLDVHGGHVRVGAESEVHLDGGTPVGGGGSHVAHVLHAVDGLFQRDDHAVHHHVGVGASVGGLHEHAGRGDVRVTLDG